MHFFDVLDHLYDATADVSDRDLFEMAKGPDLLYSGLCLAILQRRFLPTIHAEIAHAIPDEDTRDDLARDAFLLAWIRRHKLSTVKKWRKAVLKDGHRLVAMLNA